MDATAVQPLFEARVGSAPSDPALRPVFEAFFALWLPRVHHFARARLASEAAAEALTRAVLEAAVRAGLVGAGELAAPRVLALARAELARRGGAPA